ncbi:NAD(P)-dependent oxidoreductase [Nonomuraea sp. KM88]|uniref:NAD(P)-dependent oxidoreductase n=1 Tax=Nonomuraea sp. KM88 TaxID=3457427 RepID=UPI003FCD179C
MLDVNRDVGLYGLGNAGLGLAAKAKAFHMRVLGLRRRAGVPAPGMDELFGQDDFLRFLAACDFVVVTAPLTAATPGRFDRAAFAAMKRTACFVCVSRGGIDHAGQRRQVRPWRAAAQRRRQGGRVLRASVLV